MFWDAMVPAVEWLGSTSFAIWLGMSTWRVAWLFSFHLMGLTLLLGPVLVTGLNLLGLFQRVKPVARLWAEVRPVYWLGVAVTLVSGSLIFVGGAVDYYQGYWLRMKLVLLCVAVLFQATVFRATVSPARTPSTAARRVVGACLLCLWFGVAWAGRAIAFF